MTRIVFALGVLLSSLATADTQSCEISLFDATARRQYNTLYMDRAVTVSEARKACESKFQAVTVATYHRAIVSMLEANGCEIAEFVEPLLPEFPEPPLPESETKEPGWIICAGQMVPKLLPRQ